MYHGNLGAFAAAKAAPGRPRLAFNIRHSLYDLDHESRLSRLVIRAGARVSACADAVLYNSYASAEQHEALGYPKEKRHVLPNGFDLNLYRPDLTAKDWLRAELGVSSDSFVIGLIGRYHPMKDHRTFIKAAALFRKHCSSAEFVLAGRQTTAANTELAELLNEAGVSESFHLLGERRDVPRIIAGLDVLTNCSAWGEGFSNVIGEASASAVPCVVTDIGDALRIIGEDGFEALVGEPETIVEKWKLLFEMGDSQRAEVGRRLRRNMEKRYSLELVVEEYLKLYAQLLA
jgi:glycosyltransferase involved in cell wall biosynthesis